MGDQVTVRGQGTLCSVPLKLFSHPPPLPSPPTKYPGGRWEVGGGGVALALLQPLPLRAGGRRLPQHMCDSCFGFHWRQTGAGAFPFRRNSLRVANNNTNTAASALCSAAHSALGTRLDL